MVSGPADALISQPDAIRYWNSVNATVDGMLGGFPQISRIDIRGSTRFMARVKRSAGLPQERLFTHAAECGAGIGRITKALLTRIAKRVDIVEPVQKFTAEISSGADFADERAAGKIGDIYNVGMEAWKPVVGRYDLIWIQWCLGQLTDAQAVAFLKRCVKALQEGGLVFVKENISTDANGADIFDDVDSSVTRSDSKFRSIFEDAGFALHLTEVQEGFPVGLFPVRTYALKLASESL